MVASIVLVASTVIGSSVVCAFAVERPPATTNAASEIPLRGARSPVQPPMIAPAIDSTECPGWRATAENAGLLAGVVGAFWRFFASVAFVNDLYYACQ